MSLPIDCLSQIGSELCNLGNISQGKGWQALTKYASSQRPSMDQLHLYFILINRFSLTCKDLRQQALHWASALEFSATLKYEQKQL